MRLLCLADVSPTDAGRMTGQAVLWIALLAGAYKCWSISRRPTTNTKCALALMFVLLAFLLAACVGMLTQVVGTSPVMAAASALLGVIMLGLVAAAIVLAILGLIEFSRQPGVFVQGRAQAIWALGVAGVMGLIAGAGFHTNFVSPHSGYTVILTNSPWHPYESLGSHLPQAEFGASRGDSCFAVVPVWLGDAKPDPEALTAALLATLEIAYPKRETHRSKAGDRRRSSGGPVRFLP